MTAGSGASAVSDEDRAALTDTVTRFARTEIAPHVDAWDAAGEFPRSLYRRAADLGLLGLGYPEPYGGTPAIYALRRPLWRALSRHGASGGVLASLLSHNIGLPPVLALGSEDVKRGVIPPVLAGERIAALAITEPGGGSDVAALRTTAQREGGDYVVDGEKIFITSGMRADWITVAVRTGDGRGAKDISLLLVPGDSQGLSRTRLDKMGWLCSDTAHLRFDGVRVPARYLLGDEGAGFKAIMGNFQDERCGIACAAMGNCQNRCLGNHHAQVAGAGRGGVHEQGRRAGGSQRRRELAADVAAFAHAHHHHAPAGVQHQRHGAREIVVQRLQALGDPVHVDGALGWGHARPWAVVEGLARGVSDVGSGTAKGVGKTVKKLFKK